MPGSSCAERTKPVATKLSADWERWLPSPEVVLLVLAQNHFAALSAASTAIDFPTCAICIRALSTILSTISSS